MDWLQNPNVIYLLLSGGLALGVLALAAPGTGILEIIAIFTLGIAGWLIAYSGLPINWWAVGVLLVGAVLFFMSVRRPKRISLLALSILALVVGSAYLFAGASWWLPGISPALAVIVSVLLGGFFWFAAQKAIEADQARPSHDLGSLIGAIGEVRSPVSNEGSVYVGSELWSARSAQPADRAPIPIDAKVRIIGREGLILIVEPLESPSEQENT
jgi:membrane-bound serine protease (ClpP class)